VRLWIVKHNGLAAYELPPRAKDGAPSSADLRRQAIDELNDKKGFI
jgi:hypothetical protein